jgi:dienelactone hydrolase
MLVSTQILVDVMRMLGTCALLFCVTLNLSAHGQELDTELNESVLMIPKKKIFTINLETTLYKPDGAGPFPVVVINHGKTRQARDQDRFRPSLAARYFLQRGYAVVAPMRQGFSKSEGNYVGNGCDAERSGIAQADDVQATLDYVVNQSWADKTQLLVAGQSIGGWTSLAFGVRKYSGVKGLINFAGGISNPDCAGWESSLAAGAGAYAKGTDVPSLWFYGDNDSYFSTATYRAMYNQYQAAGGKARLVAFGVYQKDSHAMFSERGGAGIWQPEVTLFLKLLGMPNAPIEAYAKFGVTRYVESPPPSKYADLTEVSKIPYVRDTGRAGYREYLLLAPPRAFAIAKNGVWSWSNDGDDPLKRALERCASISKLECKLYSVDNHVVWTAE